MEQKSKFLEIRKAIDKPNTYILVNIKQDVRIGKIERVRVGIYMHWCLYFDLPFLKELVAKEQDLFFTNGCLKEISKFITSLYNSGGVKNGTKDQASEEQKRDHQINQA